MIYTSMVLTILLPNGKLYEKHLFSNKELHRWIFACDIANIPVIEISKREVYFL